MSNDNPSSESLFRTTKYRPDYARKPFTSKEGACQWVASIADWCNHRHRHSGIKSVAPHKSHCSQDIEICRHRAVVYEEAINGIHAAGKGRPADGVNQKEFKSIWFAPQKTVQGE